MNETELPAPQPDSAHAPSRALALAALGGLLCLATCALGCEDKEPSGARGSAAGVSATITAARTDTTITLESFSAECAARSGTLQIHPHCGGANDCKGMSYDSGTHVYTEHTCKGLNTCTGFSCVEPSSS